MNLAPIVVFAFNRPDSLKAIMDSLLQNTEAKESELFIFVDGARSTKAGEEEKVEAVREYVRNISGFKNLTWQLSDSNKGLGPSIIAGVSSIINQYGRAIVLEDDLILSTNFLSFMNQALDLYEKRSEVFSICGYSNEVSVPQSYKDDAYFCTRSSSWGWATWADRWNSVDWELKDWDEYAKKKNQFNRWGGSDCFNMLNNWRLGRNKSWAIRFCFNQFLQDKVSLFPIISKVNNNGFDGEGTNCKKWSRFKFIFDNEGSKSFRFPVEISINKQLRKSALSYHSLFIRIWSRVMYLIYK